MLLQQTGFGRKMCGIRLHAPNSPRPDVAGRCVNRDPEGAWWSVASGKLPCGDRCHPAAAAADKEGEVEEMHRACVGC